MNGSAAITLEAYLDGVLAAPAPPAAATLAGVLADRFPGAAIFLYGSGISVSADEDPTQILFDFYVLAPDYREAIKHAAERLAARILPPNVYYLEAETEFGMLRCKYALLSVRAFEKLVSARTFHSYFWARFAQPSRLVICPQGRRAGIIAAVRTSIETFLRSAQGLATEPGDWREVWLAGLNASYRAELRAEASDRAAKLIDHYGDWPKVVAGFALAPSAARSTGAFAAWRARALFGAALSIARLLKATATFRGGIDYIAWKVKRHAGVDVGVRPWERRHPLAAAPLVALRYYRLRGASRKSRTV